MCFILILVFIQPSYVFHHFGIEVFCVDSLMSPWRSLRGQNNSVYLNQDQGQGISARKSKFKSTFPLHPSLHSPSKEAFLLQLKNSFSLVSLSDMGWSR